VAKQIATALQELGTTAMLRGQLEIKDDITRAKVQALGEINPQQAGSNPDTRAKIEQIRAAIEVDPKFVTVDVLGKLPRSTQAVDDVEVKINLPSEGEDTVRIVGRSLDLQMPFGRFLRPFAPRAAQQCDDVLAKLSPRGTASVQALVQLAPQTSDLRSSADVKITPTSDLIFAAEGNRFVLGYEQGSLGIRVSPDGSSTLQFDNLQGKVLQAVDGSDPSATPAKLQASGVLQMEGADDPARANVHTKRQDVSPAEAIREGDFALLTLRDVAVGGSFLRTALAALNQTQLLEELDSTQADGLVDVEIALAADVLLREEQSKVESKDVVTNQARASSAFEPPFVATITPKTLVLGYRGSRLPFDSVAGTIVLEGASSGRIENVRAEKKGVVTASATGAWGHALARDAARKQAAGGEQSLITQSAPRAFNELDVQVAIEAQGLSDHARALLPRDVASTLDDLGVASTQQISLADLSLRGTLGEDASLQTFSASGTVRMQGASATLGVQIDDAQGACEFRYTRMKQSEPGEFAVDGMLTGFRVLGVGLTDGRVSLRTTRRGGLLAEQFSAQVHGGRVTGSLSLAPPVATVLMPGEAAPGRWYELSVEASNVRFAPLLEEGRALRGAKPNPVGVLSGSFMIAGKSDGAADRRGRGTLNVRGGTVVSLPVVLPLLRVSNLQLPTNDVLDFALADFYIRGSAVTLEQLSISSRAVGLYGFGTVSWPGFDLDLRFRAANRSRIPVITAIIEGVRDELVSTTVRGTLDNPQVSLRPLEGTRAMLRDLTGGSASEQERKLQAIEKQVSPEERRARPKDEELIEPRELSEEESSQEGAPRNTPKN
jgi:hypothetical protein